MLQEEPVLPQERARRPAAPGTGEHGPAGAGHKEGDIRQADHRALKGGDKLTGINQQNKQKGKNLDGSISADSNSAGDTEAASPLHRHTTRKPSDKTSSEQPERYPAKPRRETLAVRGAHTIEFFQAGQTGLACHSWHF